jgi:general secretion pathway protein L
MAAMNINRWFARYAATYRNSAARRFFSWWGTELASFLPARVRQWFIERRDQLLIQRAVGGGWALRRSDAPERVETVVAEAAPEELHAIAERLQKSGEHVADLVTLLPRGDVLERRLALPMAAEENLAQVIAFELDRQTPFRADQVRYDFRIARRDTAAKLLHVDVLLAPRVKADAMVAPLSAAGLSLHALDGDDGRGGRLGFNLLPQEARATRTDSALRLNLILAGVCVLLIGMAMQQSLTARSAALESLQAHVDQVQVEARQTSKLGNTLDEAVEGANFLASRKKQHAVAIDIIRELTEKLPMHTSLVRLSINRGEVQIQGNSSEAASLIAILQKSTTIEGPALDGAITPDARTQKEQFLIKARARIAETAPPGDATGKDGEGADAAAAKS